MLGMYVCVYVYVYISTFWRGSRLVMSSPAEKSLSGVDEAANTWQCLSSECSWYPTHMFCSGHGQQDNQLHPSMERELPDGASRRGL